MAHEGNRIQGDRGRTVTQLDPITLHVLQRYDTIEAPALDAIVEDIEPGTAAMRRRLIYLLPIIVVVIAGGVVLMYIFGDASFRKDMVSTLLNPAIMGGAIGGGVVAPWFTARQARFKLVRTSMLKHHRCPHCGYNLYALPPDPCDGLTVCPECGSAWQMGDEHIASMSATTTAHHIEQKQTLPVACTVGLLILALLGVTFFMWYA